MHTMRNGRPDERMALTHDVQCQSVIMPTDDQFTPKEERKLVRYLAKHSTLGSMGNKVFIRLCVNAEEKWGWSAAHDWKAWRALYREHQAYFDEQIRTRQDKLAEEQPRSREGADVDVRKRSSSSAVGAPYHDVVEGLHRDTIDWKDRWKEEEEEGSDECLAGTPQAPHVSVPRPRPDPYDRGNLEDEEEEDVVASDGHAISISLDAGVEPVHSPDKLQGSSLDSGDARPNSPPERRKLRPRTKEKTQPGEFRSPSPPPAYPTPMSKKRHREDEEYVAWSSPLPHSSPQPESVSPKLKHPRAKITEGVPTSRPERKSMLATRPRRDSAPSSRPSQPPAILKNRGPSPFPALVSDPVESVYLPQGNGDRKDKGKGKECDLNYLGRRRSIADPEADIPGSSRLDLGASSRLSRRSYGSLPNRRIKRSSPFMPSSPMSRRSTFSTPPPESSEFRRLSRRSYASLSSRSATHPSTPTPTPARSRTSTFSTPGPRLESSVIPSPTRALPFPIAPEDRDTVHYLGVCASLTAIAERFGFREVGVWRVWEALGSVARTEEFCRRCWEEGGGEGGVSVDGDVCALLGVGVLGAECGNKSGRTGATRIVRSSFAPTGAEIDVKEEEDEDDNMCRLRLRLGGHASGE